MRRTLIGAHSVAPLVRAYLVSQKKNGFTQCVSRVGNEREAIALYEGAAKSAMIYIRANPDKKSELTPILQRFIGRARELKGMLNTGE